MNRVLYFLPVALLFCNAYAQTPVQMITGRVISRNDSLPVSGATISFKKQTAVATTTNEQGYFSIAFTGKPDNLIVSHISYKQCEVEIKKKPSGFMLIALEQYANELQEVVVNSGFQKLAKERSTGSYTLIDNKRYNEQVGTNVLERLKYISNGISTFPDRAGTVAGNQILIRGLSTLTLSIQKPLIIVDNFEYQGDINNINPNDVENVTFLKDAAAGALWGAKAANGVIVITTKKGHYNKPTEVSVNSNITVADKPDLFYLKTISSGDLVDAETFLFKNQFRFSDTDNYEHVPFSPVYEILFSKQNGSISAAQATAALNALRTHDVRNDFEKYIYQKAVNQQYAVSVNGGSGNIAWLLSAGIDRDINELDAKYNRVNLRFDNTYKISKNLEVSTSAYYTQSSSSEGKPGYGSINTITGVLPAYTRLADDNGNPLPVYRQYRQPYIDTAGGGYLADWRYYPLEDYKHVNNTTNLQDLNAAISINYKLLNSLNASISYRYESEQVNGRVLYGAESFYTRDLINNFSQVDERSGTVNYVIPPGEILDMTTSGVKAQNLREQIDFTKSYGRHYINAIAGSEVSETINTSNSYRTYGYNNDVLTFTNVDYVNLYPTIIGGGGFVPNPANFSKTNTRFVSFYGDASYTYNGLYTLSSSIRRDASNLFGVDINNKWKPLWSSGASWNISKEKFYKVSFLPSLKFRLTYGHQGNIDPTNTGVLTLDYEGSNPYTRTPITSIKNFPNPDLKWEQVAMINAAADFAIKNNRLTGSIEFFKKSITDMYGPVYIDGTTGLGVPTITKNIGAMRGHGFDVEINSINIKRPLLWTMDFIFNTYSDIVTKYYDPSLFSPGELVGNGGDIEGKPALYLELYRWAGLDPENGNPRGYLNGTVSEDWDAITTTGATNKDVKYIGHRLPTIYGSLGNSFEWKNISLTARITYEFGYYFLRESINYSNLENNLEGHSDYSMRWQQKGDELHTNVPSFSYPANLARDLFYSNSEVLATSGSNIRLQYINISYNVGKAALKILPFKEIQLYGVINNIGIIWRANHYGIDPDYRALPPTLNYAIGLRTNF